MPGAAEPGEPPIHSGRVHRLHSMLRDPVVWILVAAGLMEMVSGGTVARGAVLFAGAALLLVDHLSGRRHKSDASVATPVTPASSLVAVQTAARRAPLLVAGVVAAAVLALFQVHTWALTAILGVFGIVVVGWAWTTFKPPGHGTRPPVVAVAPWAVLVVLLGVWELTAFVGQPSVEVGSYAHPTISFLLAPMLATYLGKVVGITIWLAAGRSLVLRA
jgi:hypothetical protein